MARLPLEDNFNDVINKTQRGLKISDADLAYDIRSLPFGSLPPDQYKQYVEQQTGVSVPEFENNLRLSAYSTALSSVALEGSVVTASGYGRR